MTFIQSNSLFDDTKHCSVSQKNYFTSSYVIHNSHVFMWFCKLRWNIVPVSAELDQKSFNLSILPYAFTLRPKKKDPWNIALQHTKLFGKGRITSDIFGISAKKNLIFFSRKIGTLNCSAWFHQHNHNTKNRLSIINTFKYCVQNFDFFLLWLR